MRQMLDHGNEAIEMGEGRTREDLDAERMFQLAAVRLLEIIGEAAGRVDHEQRQRFPQVPWRDIVGLRNRLAHGYDSINLDVVWRVITRELPPLVRQLEKILGAEGADAKP